MVCLFYFPVVRVSTTTRGKQEHAMMKVNKTGYFEEESFPTCNNGGKINLLSYQRCSTYQCNTSLSTKEKLVIHEMCSLKRTCVTSKFPQVNATINVTYQCLSKSIVLSIITSVFVSWTLCASSSNKVWLYCIVNNLII